jgi:hypothetical protein
VKSGWGKLEGSDHARAERSVGERSQAPGILGAMDMLCQPTRRSEHNFRTSIDLPHLQS